MHKDDQMTPIERAKAFANKEEIDRIPTIPFVISVLGKVIGLPLRDLRNNVDTMVFAQVTAYERLGNDSFSVDYGLHGIGKALGTTLSDPENAVPAILDFVLKDLKNISELDITKVEYKNNEELQNCIEITKKLQDKIGNECPIGASLPGPFTVCASIYPIEKLLRALKRDPENVHKLLRFSTEAIKIVYKEFFKCGIGVTIADPVASGTILKNTQYSEFVFPYTTELVDYMHENNTEVCYHICGNTTKIIEAMVDTKVDTLSLDNVVDLEYAKKKVGDRICLIGNVDPVNIIMLGDAKDIDEAVKTCFRKAYDSPKGFIIASGCDIPPGTPIENLDAFMSSCRKYGKWPLDPSLYI